MDVPVHHECLVYGRLGFVLRLSQIYGVASLKFKSVPNGWHVRVSRTAHRYSKALITITSIIGICTLAWTFVCDPSLYKLDRRADHMVPVMSLAVILVEIFAEAYCGMSRMRNMVSCLAHLQKINSELIQYGQPTSFKTLEVIIALWSIIGCHIAIILDFAMVTYRTIILNSEFTIHTLSLFFYVAVIMQKMLYLQIFLIHMTVMSSFNHLNNCLNELLQQICKKSPVKDISTTALETLQRLSTLYCDLRIVVRELNASHGFLMVSILIAILVHLVTTFYYFISRIFGNYVDYYNALSQTWWTIYHVIDLIIIVEPCHRTSYQVKHTKCLISRLMCATSKSAHDFNATLKIFYYLLTEKNIVYAPMSMFKLKRSLIATVLASFTTYLVIALQL